jgi:hypothetical protein
VPGQQEELGRAHDHDITSIEFDGSRLAEGDGAQHGLRVATSETFSTGVLNLAYVPA